MAVMPGPPGLLIPLPTLYLITSHRQSRKFLLGRSPMIKVRVMYPNRDGNRFDINCYCTKHMPRVRELHGAALRNLAVEEGLAGMTPGSPAP